MARTREDIIRIVKSLLAKAEAKGVTEDEALNLAGKAAYLLSKNNIDRAVVSDRAQQQEKIVRHTFPIANPFAKPQAFLISAIAKAVGCDTILIQTLKKRARRIDGIEVFGTKDDIDLVSLLEHSLRLSALSLARRLEEDNPWITGGELRAERTSYLMGFAAGVREELERAFAAAVHDVEEETKTSTALVLASKSELVQRALKQAYPRTRSVGGTISRADAYGSGRSDGAAAASRHTKGGIARPDRPALAR